MRPAIQLYSVRNIDAPLDTIIRKAAAVGFEGVEFAHRVCDANQDAVRDALDDTTMVAVGAHLGLDELETDLAAVEARYARYGTPRFIVPHLPPEHFTTPAAVDAVAERLDAVARALDESPVTVGFHNQDFEFHGLPDGQTAFDRLVAGTRPEVGFEFDVGAAVAAGADPDSYLDRHAERIDLVHLKDVRVDTPEPGTGQQSVKPGTGDVDLRACTKAAAAASVEWLVFEHDDPDDAEVTLELAGDIVPDLVEDAY